MIETIKKLIFSPSPSGYEKKVLSVIEEMISPYADKTYYDKLGNLIAFKKGEKEDAKKLMFASHADEIGMLVSFIDEKGFLRVTNVGYIDWPAAAYTGVLFESGMCGVVVPESNVKPVDYKREKFYVDIGCSSREEALKCVNIGDFCVLRPSFEKINDNIYFGHPFDDRIGCAMLVEATKRMKSCVNDVYFVFTVQEEVGCRGAKAAAFGIRPDYAISVDVTDTGDRIGSDPMEVSLGKGTAIKLKDSLVISDPFLTSKMREIAKGKNIPFQLEILEHGGTDSSAIQAAAEGVAVGAISVPARYIHTGNEMIDMRDAESGTLLINAMIESDVF